jgi:hypothetical protein
LANKLKWRFPPELPPLHPDPEKSYGRYSERVLVLTDRKDEKYITNASFSFGRYSHDSKAWLCEGFGGNVGIIAWAYLKKPKIPGS